MNTFIPILAVFLGLYFIYAIYQNFATVLPKVSEVWECPQQDFKLICTRVEGRHCVCTMYHDDEIIENVHIGKWFCYYDASYMENIDGKDTVTGVFSGEFLFRKPGCIYIRGVFPGEKGKRIMKFFVS